MNDPDRNRQREHWQAIAEQLGLSPEPEESSVSQVTPEERHAGSEQPRVAEQAVTPEEAADVSEDEPPRRGRRGRTARTAEEIPERAEPETPPSEVSEDTEIVSEKPQSAEETAAPKRGRRRRSARSRAGAEREAGATDPDVLPVAEGEEAEQTTERPKRRGRGRGRQKKTEQAKTSPKTAKDEKPSNTTSPPDEEEDIEAEDVRSLSNWNVPSWNELIASLYRPER